ncbi:MAG: 30S ribosomal protein S6 [Candidatus Woesebacteria bacterium]|nr:30S ribosomal protein S6 [Candidatus Woesebacteria bacterium]
MNNYELTIILEGKITSAKKKTVLENIEKFVKILEGKMDKVEDWGVKELFHQIKKNSQGAYLHIPLELPAKSIKQLDIKLKAIDNILRYLLIREENK